MLPPPCYIISDLHLGLAETALERRAVEFLRHLPGRAGSLLINGDLFDFWFEWRHVVPRGHFRTLAALADVRDAGVEVLMIGGNHDLWGGPELMQEVGVRFHVGAWRGELGGWQALVEHGHGLRDEEGRLYRALLAVFHSRAAVRAFSILHPDWAVRLAQRTSKSSRAMRSSDEGAGLRQVALTTLAAEPATELVVYAHSHVPALEKAQEGGVYANAGSWLDAPTYLVVSPERIELRRWRDSTESDLLDAVDRRA